jgi:tetratricopeptide (TPR) repeat protein
MMDNTVTLNSLHYFNAHTRSTQDVVNTFIARNNELKELEEGILSEAVKSIPQHYMIIGSRGMGKSTLLRRLEISLHGQRLSAFIPILFPEEQYNIDRLSKFWLNSLDALADSLEAENQHQLAEELDGTISGLSDLRDESKLSETAYQTLCDFCKKINRRPVFLVDNIDILFEGISADEQFKLRKLITSNGAPIFIAACTQNPRESQNYDAAFYDAFDNIYLERLDRKEMRDLLLQLAQRTGREEILGEIYEKTGQLDALHNLTGGNPRVAVFLFQLIANGLSDKIYENLNTLLDVITPLYKSNFEKLSKQAQVIVDALALNWDPCDLDMLSQITRLENNQLSAQLDRLLKSGWIERSSRFSVEKNKVLSKAKNYAVRERFFNIWYIMRRASRRQRGDLKSLTCFLETFYTPQHLEAEKKRIVKLIKENIDTDKVIYALALSKTNHDSDENPLEEQIYFEILEHTNADPEKIAKYFSPNAIPDSVYFNYRSSETARWLAYIKELEDKNQLQKAEEFLESIISLKDREEDYFIWMKLGDLYTENGKLEEAKTVYLRSIELGTEYAWPYFSIGMVHEKVQEYQQAEGFFIKAIELQPDELYFVVRLGRLYASMNQFDKAEKAFMKAIAMNPEDEYTYVTYAVSFIKDKVKFLSITDQGLTTNPKSSSLMYLKALQLWKETPRQANALYKKALKLAPSNRDYWYNYGNFLLTQKQYEEAVSAYRKALELGPSELKFKQKLVDVLAEHTENYSEAKQLILEILKIEKSAKYYYKLSVIYLLEDKVDQAVDALKKIEELDEKDFPKKWFLLGMLQMLKSEHQKAAESFEKSVKYNDQNETLWECLGSLHHFELQDYRKAADAYQKSLAIAPNNAGILLDLVAMAVCKMEGTDQARAYFEQYGPGISEPDLDYKLAQAILAATMQNFGDAKNYWIQVLSTLDVQADKSELLNLKMSIAVSQMVGFGKTLIQLFETSQLDKVFRPIYEALVALEFGSVDYLLNVAPEVRDSAREIYIWMHKYISKEATEMKVTVPRRFKK